MKKKIILLLMLMVICISLAGCANYNIIDMNYEFNYALVKCGDDYLIYEVKKWADSECDTSIMIVTTGGNYIWCSAETSTMFKELPAEVAEKYAFAEE